MLQSQDQLWLSIEVTFVDRCFHGAPTEGTAAPNFTFPRFMGPTWGSSGADRTQVGPMLAPWTLLSGLWRHDMDFWNTDPLWGESIGDRRIPITKIQWCGALMLFFFADLLLNKQPSSRRRHDAHVTSQSWSPNPEGLRTRRWDELNLKRAFVVHVHNLVGRTIRL